MCKNAVKRLPPLIRYAPDWYKTHNEVRVKNGRMLKFVPNRYKNQKMCNLAVDH